MYVCVSISWTIPGHVMMVRLSHVCAYFGHVRSMAVVCDRAFKSQSGSNLNGLR